MLERIKPLAVAGMVTAAVSGCGTSHEKPKQPIKPAVRAQINRAAKLATAHFMGEILHTLPALRRLDDPNDYVDIRMDRNYDGSGFDRLYIDHTSGLSDNDSTYAEVIVQAEYKHGHPAVVRRLRLSEDSTLYKTKSDQVTPIKDNNGHKTVQDTFSTSNEFRLSGPNWKVIETNDTSLIPLTARNLGTARTYIGDAQDLVKELLP